MHTDLSLKCIMYVFSSVLLINSLDVFLVSIHYTGSSLTRDQI